MPTLEIERTVRARPETVFAYFTDSHRYTAWMGVEAELDATPGGIYRVKVPQGFYAVGEFVEVEPPRRLVFTWGWEGDPEVPPGSSRVEITLTPDGAGTLVRLVHSGLPHQDAIAMHTQGWERYLGRLVVAGEGGDPGPDEA
jgi:uncharacterized protein YndB with AHSA1/START domain